MSTSPASAMNCGARSVYPLQELSNPRPCPYSSPSPCLPRNFSLPTGLSLSPTHLPISSPRSGLDASKTQSWHRLPPTTLALTHLHPQSLQRFPLWCRPCCTRTYEPCDRLFLSPWHNPRHPSPGPGTNSSHPPRCPRCTELSPTRPSAGLLSGAAWGQGLSPVRGPIHSA